MVHGYLDRIPPRSAADGPVVVDVGDFVFASTSFGQETPATFNDWTNSMPGPRDGSDRAALTCAHRLARLVRPVLSA